MFADQIDVALITGMSRHSRIGHDRFRPSGRDFNETSGLFRNFIANVVKLPLLRFGNDFLVGEGSLRRRVPINHPTPAVD